MIHVLKHVESITQHRDRTLLELGVASALFELVKALEVNLYKVTEHGEDIFLTQVVHVGPEGVRYVQEELSDGEETIPVSQRPEMAACVEQNQIVLRHLAASGQYLHCFPIQAERRTLGVLEVVCSTQLSEENLGTAEGFLGLYRNYMSLLDYSERDTLTGLLNRKTFDENLGKILTALAVHRNSVGDDSPLRRRQQDDGTHWLAVLDVDHFKRINDQFGHLYGDEVLLLLARLMRDCFRHQDRLFRFGGEEFVIVLRAGTQGEVVHALERLRETIESYPFPQVGQVTVSMGYTHIRPQDTIPEIVGRADEALYFAKENGRNQIACHETLQADGRIATREQPNGSMELF
ncbi:GGDEF domain-containing protein [Zoogloea sp. LCSB751]|uniref:GGDEF domain-containing protein n=1 Tax=Zoogloea sp. LCSB751 TaxID=1965277 RepID=UPI0013747A1F|nr:GGDEF domain-containing protein [Zoogloea sp. LCSB751]